MLRASAQYQQRSPLRPAPTHARDPDEWETKNNKTIQKMLRAQTNQKLIDPGNSLLSFMSILSAELDEEFDNLVDIDTGFPVDIFRTYFRGAGKSIPR